MPAEDDPLGLLQEGPYNARPPHAFGYRQCTEHGGGWVVASAATDQREDNCENCKVQKVLVLAGGGKVVRQGCETLGRTEAMDKWVVEECVRDVLRGDMTDPCWPGTLIVLDSYGREVKNVE